MACGNSILVEGLLCEHVTEQQMGSEILVQSVPEQPSCLEPLLYSDVQHASVPDGAPGLSRNDNVGCVNSGEVIESCKVDRDGLVGECENASDLELRSTLSGEWRLNRCCSTESQSNVDGSNSESDWTCLKEGGPQLEDGSAALVGVCEIPLEVICQTGSSGDGVQQDEQRDDKSFSSLYSKEVMEVTEEKGDIYLEIKNDICEPVSPLHGVEIPSEPAEMEACSSPHKEEKGFNILAGPSLEAAYKESVVSSGIEADLCNRTSPARDVELHSEVSFACDLVPNCDCKNEQMDDSGVSGLSSLSTERTTEVVEMTSNVDTCTQIFPLQGFERALEDLHMPDLLGSCAQQNDQSSDKIIDGSLVERSIEILEKNSDVMTDVEAVIPMQISPVKVDVHYSKEGPSKIASNCIIENSVSMQSCQTLGIADKSVSRLSTDMVVVMKSNINEILPPEGCQGAFEGSHLSDSPSVCTQENGLRNDKVIDFASSGRVTKFLEQKSDATNNMKFEIGTQISLMEEKVSNLKECSCGLSPYSIHEKSVSLKLFQSFDAVNNGSSESVDVPDKNDSPGNVDSSISFDRSGEKYHEGNDNVKVGCFAKTKCPDIVALSSRVLVNTLFFLFSFRFLHRLMGSAAVEKTQEELRKEIDELQRQQREITERLRDPRGLRKGGLVAASPRNFAANGAGVRPRAFTRPADRADAEDQRPAKRRLSSAVVKVEDGEITETAEEAKDVKMNDSAVEATADQSDRKLANSQQSGWSRREGNHGVAKKDFEIPAADHVPRVLPKEQDPSLVNRNKRMLGQLLGTLEKFRKEDLQLSGTEAFMRRSDSLQRAEQRAREESERLRLQEREQIAEKRRRDLTLRARVNAKTEEKKLELLFLQWSEHNKRLGNFIRTKAEPPIYYLPKKPLEEDAVLAEQRKEKEFLAWKAARREELTEYQKQIGEQYIANVEKELERWQNARKPRKANNDVMNLQETMDKELDTHRLEHGPKKRNIPDGSNNEDEDDVEDINVAEDYMIDDVLDVDANNRRGDEIAKPDAGNTSPNADTVE